MGPLGIFCHFKQVFCRNGLPRLAVGLGSHYQVPSRAGIISWSGDQSRRVTVLWVKTFQGWPYAIITGRATVIWRMSVQGMVTILGMVAFLRSVPVLRMVNALVMVTTSGYFLFPPYGHKEGKGDNEDAWD